MQDESDSCFNMKVYIRIRPRLKAEKPDTEKFYETVDQNVIMIKEQDKSKKNIKTSSFMFDKIFDDVS